MCRIPCAGICNRTNARSMTDANACTPLSSQFPKDRSAACLEVPAGGSTRPSGDAHNRRPRRPSSPSATPSLPVEGSASTIPSICAMPAVGPRCKIAKRFLAVWFFRPDSERGVPQSLCASFAMATATRMITGFVDREINAAPDARPPKKGNFQHSVAAVFRNFGRSSCPRLSSEPSRGRATSPWPVGTGKG